LAWNGVSFEITLSNGESCKLGSEKIDEWHTFDRNKKITKVEVIMNKDEFMILQMNFYSGQETLLKLGESDWHVKRRGGKVESFEINADEQLIGAELYNGVWHNGEDYFLGMTWLKCKIAK
jgi:hypothetical protein